MENGRVVFNDATHKGLPPGKTAMVYESPAFKNDLKRLCDQTLSETPFLSASNQFEPMTKKLHFAKIFNTFKRAITYDGPTRPYPYLSLLSLSSDGEENLYIPCFRAADAAKGIETLGFYHKGMDKIVILVTSTMADQKLAMMSYAALHGVAITDVKICGHCGKAAADGHELKKCPCKAVRYCGDECQKAHWSHHKTSCTRCPPVDRPAAAVGRPPLPFQLANRWRLLTRLLTFKMRLLLTCDPPAATATSWRLLTRKILLQLPCDPLAPTATRWRLLTFRMLLHLANAPRSPHLFQRLVLAEAPVPRWRLRQLRRSADAPAAH
jgi:hypothetical protein